MILQYWKWGGNFISSTRKVFLFLCKIMPCGSNVVLEYGVAWDNAVSSIFYILGYFLILAAAKGLSNAQLARLCVVRKTTFVPLSPN